MARTAASFASLSSFWALSALGGFCSGCLSVSTGSDAGAASGTMASSGASAPAMVMGANCAADPTGQVLLCQSISTCPAVAVDPGPFPNCGFRVDGTAALDVECVCSDSLCPLGSPRTCADVAQLLGAQSGFAVCGQVAEGRCVSLGGVDAGAPHSCTAQCQTECAGEPDCLLTCGC